MKSQQQAVIIIYHHISSSQVCGSLGLADLGCGGLCGYNCLSCVLIWLGASWGLSLAAQTSVLHVAHPLPVWVNSHDNSRSDGEQTQQCKHGSSLSHIMLSNVSLTKTSQMMKPKEREEGKTSHFFIKTNYKGT